MPTDATPDLPDDGWVGIQPQEFLPLGTLAGALIILLATTISLTAARLIFVGQRYASWEIGIDTRPLVVLSVISGIATAIVFLIWFHRARINAERSDWPQRRGRGWTFWGWVVPVVNLWFPFQIMGDIWRAGLPPAQRSRTAWLPVTWWICWLLSSPPVWIHFGSPPKPPSALTQGWLNLAFFAIAGAALIAIIRTVSNGPVGTRDPLGP